MTKPPFITFYSFKGGVGRTQAVANVGAQLASRGFRVLLVDFDLEAPGLTWLDKSDAGTPGVVDLLLSAKREGPQAELFTMEPSRILAHYSHRVVLPDAMQSPEGSLRIMPAGRNTPGYGGALQVLNLGELYASGAGKPLIEHFKAVLQSTDELDFVLVDSRTGFSDESGICTRDLADGVVMVVGLNRQNRLGSARFLSKLKTAGPLPLAVAMSPVPNSEDDAVDAAEASIENLLSQAWGAKVAVDVRIPYQPQLALSEDLRFWPPSRPLGLAYQNLFTAVMAVAGLRPDDLVQRVLEAAKKQDADATAQALQQVGRLAPERVEGLAMEDHLRRLMLREDTDALHTVLRSLLPGHSWVADDIARALHKADDKRARPWWELCIDADPTDADTLGNYAIFLAYIEGDHDAADAYYRRAIHAAPQHVHNLESYAWFLANVREDHDAAEALFRRAIHTDPTDASALRAYATFLTDIRSEHDSANALYQRAVDAAPRDANALLDYATFLIEVREDHDAADSLLKRATEAYPQHAAALTGYAAFLTTIREDHDAAEDLFKRAIDVEPNQADALGHYAVFLYEVRGDHDTAEVLYSRAIEAEPDDAHNIANYAELLLIQSRFREARDLIARVRDTDTVLAVELVVAHLQWSFQLDNRAWSRLGTLLLNGVRSPRWKSAASADAAIAHGHPNPNLVRAVASVISDQADISTLDAFPEWTERST